MVIKVNATLAYKYGTLPTQDQQHLTFLLRTFPTIFLFTVFFSAEPLIRSIVVYLHFFTLFLFAKRKVLLFII